MDSSGVPWREAASSKSSDDTCSPEEPCEHVCVYMDSLCVYTHTHAHTLCDFPIPQFQSLSSCHHLSLRSLACWLPCLLPSPHQCCLLPLTPTRGPVVSLVGKD